MQYVLKNAKVLGRQNKLFTFLIEEGKLVMVRETASLSLKKFQVDLSSFFIEPGKIIYKGLFQESAMTETSIEWVDKLICTGHTTFLTTVHVNTEREIRAKLDQARHILKGSKIDYVLGLQTSVEKLTPSFIRECKRQQLAFIDVTISSAVSITKLPWGWIKEALFPNPPAMFLNFASIEDLKQKKIVQSAWKVHNDEIRIFSTHDLPHHSTLSKPVLKQIGIYPYKGEFLQQADLDYNLYFDSIESEKLDDQANVLYDKKRIERAPVITYLRGNLLQCDGTITVSAGYGEELKVPLPGYFTSNF